jgi:hypothetical protein
VNKATSDFFANDIFSSFALYSPGLYLWLTLYSVLIFLLKRRKDLLIPCVLLFTTFLTVLASPVNGSFRYIYWLVVCTPVILTVAFSANKVPFKGKKLNKQAHSSNDIENQISNNYTSDPVDTIE